MLSYLKATALFQRDFDYFLLWRDTTMFDDSWDLFNLKPLQLIIYKIYSWVGNIWRLLHLTVQSASD